MQEGTIRALKSFAVLMPEARWALLCDDLTQTTATDVDSWIEAAFRHPLAPSTVATRLRSLQGFFAFLHEQGAIAQSPMRFPRPHSIGFSGGQLPSYVEGSPALDFPLIHNARSQDQPKNNIKNINRLIFYH